jgi:hypothetical protein
MAERQYLIERLWPPRISRLIKTFGSPWRYVTLRRWIILHMTQRVRFIIQRTMSPCNLCSSSDHGRPPSHFLPLHFCGESYLIQASCRLSFSSGYMRDSENGFIPGHKLYICCKKSESLSIIYKDMNHIILKGIASPRTQTSAFYNPNQKAVRKGIRSN